MNPSTKFACECVEQLAALAALPGLIWCVAVYGAVIFTVRS